MQGLYVHRAKTSVIGSSKVSNTASDVRPRCKTSITCSRSSQETVHSAHRFIKPGENSKTELLYFKSIKAVQKGQQQKDSSVETVHWGDPK